VKKNSPQSLKIYEIVTFDFGYQFINENERTKIKSEIKKKYPNFIVEDEEFNPLVYDCEFIRINKNKRPIIIAGLIKKENIEDIIQTKLLLDENDNFDYFKRFLDLGKLNFRIVLDSYGIGTLRTEFELSRRNNIKTINIIESTIAAGRLVDRYLFPYYFKRKILESLCSAFEETKNIILEEHETYPIIVANNKHNFSKKEIYGIVWKDKNMKKSKPKSLMK